MIISGIQKTSLVDYPGKVACVLFTPGCNYNCYYCHNRSLLDGSLPVMDMDEIRAFLEKRKGILDAVVVSGGEAVLQEGLAAFLSELKDMGYLVKLDTNGSGPAAVAELLLTKLCDYYAVDYKAPAARYREFAGEQGDAARVLKTIRLLQNSGTAFEVRTTVTPLLRERDLRSMAKELPALTRWVLNPYRIPEQYLPRDAYRIRQTPYTEKEIAVLRESVRDLQPGVC